MKNLSIASTLGLLLVSTAAHAASASASVTVSVHVVTGMMVTNTIPLEFGNVIPSSSIAGTVTVAATDVVLIGTTGGPALGIPPPFPSAASFDLKGDADATYAVTLPLTPIYLGSETTMDTMAVDVYTSTSTGSGTLDSNGVDTVFVGATLHVAAGQAAGSYTGMFDISVDYN